MSERHGNRSMSVMDKFLTYMRLNNEEDEEYDDDYDYDDDDGEVMGDPPPRKAAGARSRDMDGYEDGSAKRQSSSNKITPIKQPARRISSGNMGMEVCVIKPTSVEDAREITETLLANRTVVLNLEGLDVDVAQRIIDFTSGSCFAISGNLQKISHYIFIITPSSVDISGDFQDIFNDSFDLPINN